MSRTHAVRSPTIIDSVTSAEYRLTDCPFRCGVPVRHRRLQAHTHFCPRRILPCDSHKKCCHLPLAEYFKMGESRSSGGSAALTSDALTYQHPNLEDSYTYSLTTQSFNQQDHSTISNIALQIFAPNASGFSDTIEVDTMRSSFERVPQSSASYYESNVERIEASTVSIEGRVEFQSKLRLHCCEKHRTTVLMAAVRHNDKDLLLSTLQHMADFADLDLENHLGDTALSLACRLRRADMVQLLIEHGADVNHESFNGRTPLIEGIQAEAPQIVDELIKCGASVSKKTRRSGMHALTWARRYRNEDVIRVVELGYSVEKRTEAMLLDISCGRIDRIRAAVKGGSPFKAGVLPRYHEELNLAIDHLGHARKLVQEWREKVEAAQAQVSASAAEEDKSRLRVLAMERTLSEAQSRSEGIYQAVETHFQTYLSKAAVLKEADISEVCASLPSQESTRVSTLAYGLIFGVLDTSANHPWDAEGCRKWWSAVCGALQNAKNTILRLQLFNLRKFMRTNKGYKLQRLHQLHLSLEAAIQREVKTKGDKEIQLAARKCHSTRKRANASVLERLLSLRSRNVVYDEDEDASSSGKWVKGKWVSGKYLRSRGISQNDEEYKEEEELKISQVSTESAGVSMFFFVELMQSLLESIHELYSRSDDLRASDEEISHLQSQLSNMRESHLSIQQSHAKVVEHRDLREKELVFRLKHLKAMESDVENSLARLKVTRVLSLVSPSGYTAVAWAGRLIVIWSNS